MANRKIFKRHANGEKLRAYVDFYNVHGDDPEQMGKIGVEETYAQFHASYVIEMLAERNIRYTKNFPRGIVAENYIIERLKRISKSNHIQTFSTFIEFCEKVKTQIV